MEIYINEKESDYFTKDYNEYELLKKYYVVWLFTSEKRWYQEVDEPHFLLAKKEMWKNNQNPNCIPYLLYTEYFVKNDYITTPVMIDKRIFDDIEYWQKYNKNHDLYIVKKYRCRNKDSYIEEYASTKDITDEKVIHSIFEENLINFTKNNLTDIQLLIFSYLFFEELSVSQIADILSVSRQAVYKNLNYLKRKIKNFLN